MFLSPAWQTRSAVARPEAPTNSITGSAARSPQPPQGLSPQRSLRAGCLAAGNISPLCSQASLQTRKCTNTCEPLRWLGQTTTNSAASTPPNTWDSTEQYSYGEGQTVQLGCRGRPFVRAQLPSKTGNWPLGQPHPNLSKLENKRKFSLL